MAEETFEIDDLEEDLNEIGETTAKKKIAGKNIWVIAVVVTVLAVGGILFGLDFFSSDDSDNISNLTSKKSTKEAKSRSKKRKIKYELLYEQLPPGQVSDVIKELSFSNIIFNLEQKGKNYGLLIEQNQIEEARILLASKGLPSTSIKGYALLDESQTLGVTEFDKKVRFLRALSGELEKVISKIEMIEDAKVQIVMPKERLFVTTQPNVTASILVRVKQDYNISDGAVFSIMQLVAKAVENLQVENIAVVDTEGRNLTFGLLERIKNKQEKMAQDEINNKKLIKEIEDESTIEEISKLQPVIPNFKNIKQWFTIKENYEKNILEKINKQLEGVFPIEAYKVAVNTEISAMGIGNSAEIKRTTVSIIVDELNDDTYLDREKKIKVFSTVAAIIGYKKDRDIIQLSQAPFYTPEPSKIWVYVKWIMMIVGSILLGLGVFYFIKQKQKKNQQIEEEKNQKFEELKEEIEAEKIINTIKEEIDKDAEIVSKAIEALALEE